MKTWNLVSGILSIIFTLVILFQSCAAGIVTAIEDSGDMGGAAGLLVAVLVLAGGIVSISTRSITGKGGDIAIIILFYAAALLAFLHCEVYKDLIVWGIWCAVNVALAGIHIQLKDPGQELT